MAPKLASQSRVKNREWWGSCGNSPRTPSITSTAPGPGVLDALRAGEPDNIKVLSCADLPRSLAFYGGLLGGVESYRFPEAGEPAFGLKLDSWRIRPLSSAAAASRSLA